VEDSGGHLRTFSKGHVQNRSSCEGASSLGIELWSPLLGITECSRQGDRQEPTVHCVLSAQCSMLKAPYGVHT